MGLETWLYIGLGVIVLGILIYQMMTSKKKRRVRFLRNIRKAYGQVPKREYSYDELLKIKAYFEKTKDQDGYYVDDITWNDLDMDTIFMAMNNTFSSPGEEVLYDMLRTPCFDQKELDERERLIKFFESNDACRESYQTDFATIGRTKKVALVDYIDRFNEIKVQPAGVYMVHPVALIIAIAMIFWQVVPGIIAVLVVAAYNIYTYYRDKANIEIYYSCLQAISMIGGAAERVLAHKDPELELYRKELEEHISFVRPICKDMKWLGNGNGLNINGDLLQVFMDYLRMLTHIDFIKFNGMVGKVQKNADHVMRLFYVVGYLESMISVSSYRQTIPFYCKGNLDAAPGTNMEIKDAYHPMLEEPVANSIKENRCVLLTGSNASGKSTFLKTVAICGIMAQTVNTVPAHEYHAGFYRIYSSMALRDDLAGNESYYMVEIKSLKRIMDAVPGKYPVLCFVDEVLRGTNTVERIAASSHILQMLAKEGVLCFAATHDIELTQMLEEYYSNYHFKEDIIDGEIKFNYCLNQGRATTRNAIKLLSVMGYDEEVIQAAETTAERFVNEGVWVL